MERLPRGTKALRNISITLKPIVNKWTISIQQDCEILIQSFVHWNHKLWPPGAAVSHSAGFIKTDREAHSPITAFIWLRWLSSCLEVLQINIMVGKQNNKRFIRHETLSKYDSLMFSSWISSSMVTISSVGSPSRAGQFKEMQIIEENKIDSKSGVSYVVRQREW